MATTVNADIAFADGSATLTLTRGPAGVQVTAELAVGSRIATPLHGALPQRLAIARALPGLTDARLQLLAADDLYRANFTLDDISAWFAPPDPGVACSIFSPLPIHAHPIGWRNAPCHPPTNSFAHAA